MLESRRKESGFNVDELGCGFVNFEGGLTMDILESWAVNLGEFPKSMIAGSVGGLTMGYGNDLKYYNEVEGFPMETTVDTGAEMYRTRQADPNLHFYDDSQVHLIAALRGQCPLLNTAEVALATMLVSEGIYMSGELNREVSAEEIIANSKSMAIKLP